ncbi:NmrA family NAD(P)-binding protein [Intrasporangium sp. YIM S08009]|uniref:NmrA family NAD(P)-binding protein n=1 Tax=Intrasporangium zincisolvens TaxID=3080018 RepID=UPI002B057280|nr:NmrA family NAD(P)-binding protein [Intrasporangium sp. YIM S08009]
MRALVIGATGKTGRAVTRALASRGVDVRAAVRSADAADRARAAGARSASVVDLETGACLDAALDGVEAVYHLAPNVHPDEVGIALRVASAARVAGVARFAFHSVLHPDDASMPHHVRKGEAEAVVRDLHPDALVLRPAAYHQNLLDAARAGRIAVPYSLDTPFTNVDLDDVAEVAALLLTGAAWDTGAFELAGPERLSVRELADVASRTLGREVVAERTSLDAWRAGPGARLSASARDDLEAMFAAYDRDGLVGDPATLARLLPHPSRTWSAALTAG